jgi:hypothetical protein
MVGRLPCRLLHRSATTGRDEGNAAFLPRAFAPTGARLELLRTVDSPAVKATIVARPVAPSAQVALIRELPPGVREAYIWGQAWSNEH